MVAFPRPNFTRRPPWLDLLAGRDFRWMLLNTFVLDMGYYLRIAAQSWVVLELTNQPVWVGLVNGVRIFPVLALSLVGGVVTDRMDRRHILFWVRSGLAGLALTAALLISTGSVRPWHLIGVSLGIGAVISFGSPAYYAFIFDLAGKSRLWVANSMMAVVSNAGAIAGPVMAGALLAGTGADAVFYIAAALYMSGAIGILFIRAQKTEAARPAPMARELRAGLSYVRNTPHIAWLLVISLTTIAHSAIHPLLPFYAKDILNRGAAGYGLLTGAFGLGLFCGSVLLALMPVVKRKGMVILIATLVWDVAMAGFGFSRTFPLSMFLVFVIGVAGAYYGNALVTMLQSMSSDQMRGRVMSIFSITAEFAAVGWFIGGALAQWIGNEHALVIAAAAGAGLTLVAFAASPVLRRS
ncbi:MAG: MFS transporter [Dehalococcoidia bacterium]|nr:MFS transporter [Dehalococcoidia bacterium]MSQ34425.1 MFS transporter [Dehalococcoidia bacterium]